MKCVGKFLEGAQMTRPWPSAADLSTGWDLMRCHGVIVKLTAEQRVVRPGGRSALKRNCSQPRVHVTRSSSPRNQDHKLKQSAHSDVHSYRLSIRLV